MSKNKKNGGNQAPAQQHAEGDHGQKTTDFLRQQHAEQTGAAASTEKRAESQAGAKRKGS